MLDMLEMLTHPKKLVLPKVDKWTCILVKRDYSLWSMENHISWGCYRNDQKYNYVFCLGWILFMNALLMIELSGLQRFVMVWLLPSQRCFQVLPAGVLSLQVWDQFRDCTKVLLFPMCPPAGGAGGEQCCKLSILLLLLLLLLLLPVPSIKLQFVQLGISCSTKSKSKCKSKLSWTCIAEAIFATRHNKLQLFSQVRL